MPHVLYSSICYIQIFQKVGAKALRWTWYCPDYSSCGKCIFSNQNAGTYRKLDLRARILGPFGAREACKWKWSNETLVCHMPTFAALPPCHGKVHAIFPVEAEFLAPPDQHWAATGGLLQTISDWSTVNIAQLQCGIHFCWKVLRPFCTTSIRAKQHVRLWSEGLAPFPPFPSPSPRECGMNLEEPVRKNCPNPCKRMTAQPWNARSKMRRRASSNWHVVTWWQTSN